MLKFNIKRYLSTMYIQKICVIIAVFAVYTIALIMQTENSRKNLVSVYTESIRYTIRSKLIYDEMTVTDREKMVYDLYNKVKDSKAYAEQAVLDRDYEKFVVEYTQMLSLEKEMYTMSVWNRSSSSYSMYPYRIYTDKLYFYNLELVRHYYLSLVSPDRTLNSLLNYDAVSKLSTEFGIWQPISLFPIFLCICFILFFNRELIDDNKYKSIVESFPISKLKYELLKVYTLATLHTVIQTLLIIILMLIYAVFCGMGNVMRMYQLEFYENKMIQIEFIHVSIIFLLFLWLINIILTLVFQILYRITRSIIVSSIFSLFVILGEHLLLFLGQSKFMGHFFLSYYFDILPTLNGFKNVLLNSNFTLSKNFMYLMLIQVVCLLLLSIVIKVRQVLKHDF